jgi:hypothetical protein
MQGTATSWFVRFMWIWLRSHAATAVAINMSTGIATQIHVRSFISLAEDLRQSLVTNAKLRLEIGMRRWPGVP